MARSFSGATGNATLEGSESQDVGLDALACSPNSGARPIASSSAAAGIVRVGRYEFADCIAKGGMATVHFARLHGDFDFCRVVAVKRLLPQFASDEQFKAQFIEEARLAARIRHPNVVPTLDVVADRDEVLLVMDYVHGDSLSALSKHLRSQAKPIAPFDVTTAILSDVLRGLAFAHATTDKDGKPLNIVHCDVSPQNILVGVDGVARVLDFGIAKATTSLPELTQGVVRGKPGYISPEQLRGAEATPQSDLFAVGVVLWEMLTGQRLFGGAGFRAALAQRYHSEIEPPSARNPAVGPALEAVVMKALARDPAGRYRSATEMMHALEVACPPARPSAVADWVEELAANTLLERAQLLSRLESEKRRSLPAPRAFGDAEWLSPDEVGTDGISTARSLKTTLERLPKRRRHRVIAATGVLAVTFGVGGLLSRTFDATAPGAAASAPNPNISPNPSAEVVDERPRVAALDATANVGATAVETATSRTATSSTATSNGTTPSEVVAPIEPIKPASRASNARAPKCSPPYTIDSAGRKHYRAECFR